MGLDNPTLFSKIYFKMQRLGRDGEGLKTELSDLQSKATDIHSRRDGDLMYR